MVSLRFHLQKICKPQQNSINQFNRSIISELHGLDIPKIDPYTLQNVLEFPLLNPNLPLNVVGRESNVSVYGMENMKIHQIKYIHEMNQLNPH